METKKHVVTKEHRGMFATWDTTPAFQRCWDMTYKGTPPPEQPMGRIVTRQDKGHENMLPEIGIYMGSYWLFPAETLDNATNVQFITPKIGIFGGSFDPIHNSHIDSALEILESRDLHHIVIMPAAISPHKLDRPPTSFEHRVNMIQLAIKDHTEFSCDPREGNRPGPSFTIDTIEELKQEHPATQFYLMLGMDQVLELEKWHRTKDLLALVKLTVIERPPGGLSSTQIRNRIPKGESIDGLTPPAVRDYIQQNQLYC